MKYRQLQPSLQKITRWTIILTSQGMYRVKKIEPIVDNLTEAEQKRLKLIQQIQEMYQSGISIREITRRIQISRQTTKKYLNGNPLILCRTNKRSSLDQHKDFIIKCLTEGKTQSETARLVMDLGCVLQEIEKCIREFREIFRTKKMPLLYLFIERYKNSSIKELASFANGLEKDISAVENAVASDLSNAFVEGTNSKVKMVKRTMYGRCSKKLLAAKLMYSPA